MTAYAPLISNVACYNKIYAMITKIVALVETIIPKLLGVWLFVLVVKCLMHPLGHRFRNLNL